MEDIVGRRFLLENEEFTVVDTRQIGGEMMVYADPIDGPKGPGRAAFRLADIESKLDEHIAA